VAPRRKRGDRVASAEQPVIVASNRLPFTFARTAKGLERRPSAGGLVTALEPVLRKRGGTWIGWPGIEVRADEHVSTRGEPYRIRPVLLSETDVQRYYHGFSNRTLWPLMHSLAARARFEARDYEQYADVNRRFAEVAVEESEDAGLVWVHDYQLMLAPPTIRKARPDTNLAFFLHIPFPPHDIFRLLPWDREILRGLLTCDLIGFQVRGYVHNFLDCAERTLGARVDRDAMIVEYGDRTTRIGAYPIGIGFEIFEAQARAAAEPPGNQREKVVLGVDRLDYTKGIPERIQAFERLLELHPEHREKIVLTQLAVPSRAQVTEYLVADPLPLPDREPGTPLRSLPRRRRRAGDTASGRNEPGGEGIHRLPGGRARRPGVVAPGRSGGHHARGAPGEPLRHRRHRRGDPPGPHRPSPWTRRSGAPGWPRCAAGSGGTTSKPG
jgi:trehalose-6-phosphate synthase